MSRRTTTVGLIVIGVLLSLSGVTGCGRSESTPSGKEESAVPASSKSAAGPAKQAKTGKEALELMVAAYRGAASYADRGKVRLLAEKAEQKIDETADFSVAMVRPNKLRAKVYQATVVCDGENLHASLRNLPQQVVARKAPEKLGLRAIYSDGVLGAAMNQGFAGGSPQLVLLLGDDPLKSFLQDAGEPDLKEPGTIGEWPCYRVQVQRPEGTLTLWIDQQTFVLRRIVLPTDEMRQAMSEGGEVQSISLVADFDGAELNASVDPKAFQFDVPADAKIVKFFIPPHPAELLGKKFPPVKLVDLKGEPITAETLAKKITVIDFWATWCKPCRESLPNLEKVQQRFKGKVAFLAVSVDDPQTEAAKIQKTFDELNVTVPIGRDAEMSAGALLHFSGIPAMFILGPGGIVQDFEEGFNPNLATVLPGKLEKLLAGEDIFEKPLKEYQESLKQYEQSVEKTAETVEPPAKAAAEEIPIPQAKIADRSEPKTFKLSPLWKCTETKAPGNLLLLGGGNGPPRLAAIESWRSIVEIGLNGKLLASHELKLGEREAITNLRSAAGGDGKRYFAAFAAAQQRFFFLDQRGEVLWSYPPDAAENSHPGIADVQLADLDGDGVLEVYVGYWGVVGVQAVALDGKLIWKNRSLENVSQMTVTGPDAQGRSLLLCANSSGSLIVLDAKGQRQTEIAIPNRPLRWVGSAEFQAGKPRRFCAMTGVKLGENVAVGVNLDGKELWNYPLPDGVAAQPVEPIIAGRLKADGPGQWLLCGADGSIHVLSADGKPLDRFNYGAVLCGLATAEIDGSPALIVSTPAGIEAWKVQ